MIFKNIEYWAEEYIIPLYLMSKNDFKIFKEDFLCLTEGQVTRMFLLNDRPEKERQIGLEYFSSADYVESYEQEVNEVSSDVSSFKTSADCVEDFNNLLLVFESWVDVYMKTEAFRTDVLKEKQHQNIDQQLKELAVLRFKMRQTFEDEYVVRMGKVEASICERFDLDDEEMLYYTYPELLALFDKGERVSSSDLNKRKSGYIYYKSDGTEELLVGEKFSDLKKEIDEAMFPEDDSLLRGVSASRGKTTGIVKIVIHNMSDISDQIKNFQEGQIIVTEMTRPQTVVACRKAGAIVTDEGGITSHAAILARELKIPCVIGTKFATKVLKDGDEVEVDADEGVVRILSR